MADLAGASIIFCVESPGAQPSKPFTKYLMKPGWALSEIAVMSWRRSGLFAVALFLICFLSSYPNERFVGYAATTPQFVQEIDNQVNSGKTSSVSFASPITIGNTIVVYLIWDNTGSASVSDSAGNNYVSAVSAARWSDNNYSAQVFYARNVKAGVTTVTAAFATSVQSFGIVYAHEYSGIDPTTPVDGTSSAVGNSETLNSGSVLTKNATDLLFGAGVSWHTVTAPGAGYVARSTAYGNLTEDRTVLTKGSYSATATQSSGPWAMQLVAFRAANGVADTTAPTVPTGLSASVISTSQINLTWVASSDPDNPSGQISYSCIRNGVRFATTAAGTTSCSDTGLSPSTTYTYVVSAQDPAGNTSALSGGVQATTQPLPVPVIASFSSSPASIITGQSSTLNWNVSNATSLSIDNGVGTVTGLTSVSVHPTVTTVYRLTASNSFGSSTAQASLTVTADTTAPSAPTGLSTSVISSSQIDLSWAPSGDPDDAPGQISYGCYRNGVRFATTPAGVTSCSDTGLSASTTYTYSVSAQDPTGNSSAPSAGIQATTQALPVPVITSFTSSPVSIVAGQFASLSWNVTNSTSITVDNGVGNVTGLPSFSVHPVVTTVYQITATNSFGSATAQASVTVNADSTAPSVPTGLSTSVVSASQIDLSWAPSSDPDDAPAQISYGCYRNGVRFATTPAGVTSCSDTGLSASTTYTYSVSAQDPTGNSSAPSAGVQATTQALPVPVISTFSSNPTSIIAGQTGTLSWNVSNATSITVDNGVGDVTGTTSITVRPAATTLYQLTATNSFGSVTAQVSLTVTTEATPPTVPTGLTLTVVSYSQINLSWNASSDPDDAPEQIRYGCFRNSVRFATTAPGATSCSDTGLTAATTYVYSVSAQDAVGNSSATSAGVQATTQAAPVPTITSFGATPDSIIAGQFGTLSWNVSNATSMTIDNGVGTVTGATSVTVRPAVSTVYQLTATNSFGSVTAQVSMNVAADTVPPAIPGNLTAIGISISQIDLSWAASADNVGTTGYQVYRNGSPIATTTATSYSDTGLTGGTSYTYGVAAFDAAGNASVQATAGTSTVAGDTQAPTVSISAPANSQTVSGILAITADATDNIAVVGVQFYIDGAKFGQEATSAPYSVTWNTFQTYNTTHVLTAVARDAAGNTTTSAAASVTVNNPSLRPYSTNFSLSENPISEGGNWINGKTDGLDWADVRTIPGLAFGTQTGNNGFDDSVALVSGTWGPDQSVQATVHSVNQSLNYFEEVELWLRGNITAHSATGYEINFRCTGDFSAGYMQIVRWNGPLSSYTYVDYSGNGVNGVKNGDVVKASITGTTIKVWVNDILVGQATDNSYSSGRPGMGFFLQNAGAEANADFGFTNFTATDSTIFDTMPPTTPTNLSALGVSSSQINLSWTPSTDNVAVTGYQIFRNNVQVGTSTGSSFYDLGLSGSSQYPYSVAAFDAAGNVSLQSASTTGTTLSSDTIPPAVPSGLQSSNITSNSITISWTPSTDNAGVAGYQVFRNGVNIGTAATASFLDSGLAASTTYVYTVAAYDFSNNVSQQSQQIAATTASTTSLPPSFVQSTENQISNGSSVSVAFNTSTSAGNTIVAYVIWSNSGSVALADSRGNTFSSVSAPIIWGSGFSAQVFYATGITGGADAVTAAFRNAVSNFGVIYIHEYSGISTSNPVDFTASATGSSPFLNSGSINTPGANYLIFGAGVSENTVTAAGTDFIARSLAFGNITEDRIAGSPGTYSATALHNALIWAMQVVAFRPAN
jgi:chitodextrinase